MSFEEDVVPIERVAKHFTVSVSAVRAWMRTGIIPRHCYLKIGGTYRFSIPKIMDHLAKENEADSEKEQAAPKTYTPPIKPPVQLEFDFYNNPDRDI